MIIKKATSKDIGKIAKLMLEEFRKPPYNERASLKSVLKSLNFYFKLGKVYFATTEDEIMGVVVFKIEQYWEGPVIIIEDLAVKKQFKTKGVGKALLNEVENYAKKNQLRKILFKTNKKSSAVKFYQKYGYKPLKNVINFEKKVHG